MSDAEKLELVDSHLHLWDLSSHRWYPAMQEPAPGETFESLGDVTRMARDFLLPEYRAEAAGYELAGLVHVSAVTAPRAYIEETAWVDGAAGRGRACRRRWSAPSTPGSRGPSWRPTSRPRRAASRLRGIRVLTGLDPGSAFAADLCEVLTERGLLLDLVAHPGDAAGLRPLLERFSDLDVVLEHAGWPDGTGAGDFAAWKQAIAGLAEHAERHLQGLRSRHGHPLARARGAAALGRDQPRELRPRALLLRQQLPGRRDVRRLRRPGRGRPRRGRGARRRQQRRAFFVDNARRVYGL